MAQQTPENRPGVMSRIAVVSVAVSVAVMLVALSVVFGFKREITAQMMGFMAPVEVLDGAGIYTAESRPISASSRLETLLQGVDGVRRVAPYAVKNGIMRTQEGMEGVLLKGVDGRYDWTFFADRMVEGSLPQVGGPVRTKELLISERTGRLLNLHVGEKVEMLFVGADRTPRRDRFKVVGIYSTGMEELERTRMIGLLKAMGMENRRVRRIFLYRAAFIVGRGLIWGNAAAGLLCGLQAHFHLVKLDPTGYMLSEVPIAMDAGWWLAVNIVAAAVILLLLLAPATLVARIRPDEAIKSN